MANNDYADRATEYWLNLASASSGSGNDSQRELFEERNRESETEAPRRAARARPGR